LKPAFEVHSRFPWQTLSLFLAHERIWFHIEPTFGGGGYSPQDAAANFSGDPATPPSRLEELQTGREGLRLRESVISGLSGHVLSGLAAVR
jgi:hypothetical protein